jgi:hypothetical protein
MRPAIRPGAFGRGETALHEPLAMALERGRHPADIHKIRSDPEDHAAALAAPRA